MYLFDLIKALWPTAGPESKLAAGTRLARRWPKAGGNHVFSLLSTLLPPPPPLKLKIRASIPPTGAASPKRGEGWKWHPQPQQAAAAVTRTASRSAQKTALQTSRLFVSQRIGGLGGGGAATAFSP